MADGKYAHLLTVFPELVWNRIAEELDPDTFVTFRNAIPELESTIQTTIAVKSLFPAVFKVLYEKSYVDFTDAKNCRKVCHKWSSGVDNFFQKTNFDTIKNTNGARNQSDFVLKLPLRLVDINQLYELDLHPRCVSFGKKLTLKMCGFEPRHRRELRDMVKNVTSVWQHFEHLQIQLMERSSNPDRMIPIDRSEPEIFVPFGQLGTAKNVKICKVMEQKQKAKSYQNWYRKFKPDRFDMYVPFLHHLTNLKTVTLLLNDRHRISQILLRIPRIGEMERIFIGSNLKNMHVSWHTFMYTVYRMCCNKLTFLSGCEVQSLEKFVGSNDVKEAKRKFEKLTELHVTISRRQDLGAMMRVSQQKKVKLGDLFPRLKILQVKVASDQVYRNVMSIVNEFALQFPTLEHFSLAGHCVPPECLNLDQVYGRKTIRVNPVITNAAATTTIINSSNSSSSMITTFQFECPSHVPWKLMQCFPLLKHVIIAEQPGRCRRRVSKSKDRAYIRAFFKLFESHLRTITFVPARYLLPFEVLVFEPGAITHRQSDKRWQAKKRKRNDDE